MDVFRDELVRERDRLAAVLARDEIPAGSGRELALVERPSVAKLLEEDEDVRE